MGPVRLGELGGAFASLDLYLPRLAIRPVGADLVRDAVAAVILDDDAAPVVGRGSEGAARAAARRQLDLHPGGKSV